MRREHQTNRGVGGIPAFDAINAQYPNILKCLLLNATMTSDGLLYFLVATSQSWTSTIKLVICDIYNIIFSQNITLRGTYGNYGAACDGHIGIFTNNSNYGYYCYTYYYNMTNNTLTAERQINIGRNWYWSNGYAYKRNNNYFVVGTFNNSSRGPTTVNMTTGQYYVNEFSNPKDDAYFFYNNYSDTSKPFLAISGARRSDGVRDFYIKKWPNTYSISHGSGTQLSNTISNNVEANNIVPLPYYDVAGKIQGYATTLNKLVAVSDDYTTITLSNTAFPAAYIAYRQILLSDGTGYYCDSSYNYQRYSIADYM